MNSHKQSVAIFILLLMGLNLTRAESAGSNTSNFVRCWILFDRQIGPDFQPVHSRNPIEKGQRFQQFVHTLQDISTQSRIDFLPLLESAKTEKQINSWEFFWIVNAVLVDGQPIFFEKLKNYPNIRSIVPDRLLTMPHPIRKQLPSLLKTNKGHETSLDIIGVPELWAMGITGAGRLVMNIDNGVDGNHPQLSARWRGLSVSPSAAWYDPSWGSMFPEDRTDPSKLSWGHGTHTMATLAGCDPLSGDTVGVAIEAEWIAANAISGGNPHTSRTISAFQWAIDPDEDPATISDRPDVINCSWYDGNDTLDFCDENSIYRLAFQVLEAADITVIFSAGNQGNADSTISQPAGIVIDSLNTFCVGNLNGAAYLEGHPDPIFSQSSHGPSSCPVQGALAFKPETVAPGTDIRSAVPGGSYQLMTGTSMASPHVAGLIALLKQICPERSGREIKSAIYETAIDLGINGEDNTYGRGLINAPAALRRLIPPDTIPPEIIVSLSAEQIFSHSIALKWQAPTDTSRWGVRGYDCRYSHSPITDSTSFSQATIIENLPTPALPGEWQSLVVTNLEADLDYYFCITSLDLWGNRSPLSNSLSVHTLGMPILSVFPDSFSVTSPIPQVDSDTFLITNTSHNPSALTYQININYTEMPFTLTRNTKSSTESYIWRDSRQSGGPHWEWRDISMNGKKLTDWKNIRANYLPKDEGFLGPVDLPFPFPFYDKMVNKIYISSNGFICFDSLTTITSQNKPIPDSSSPNGIIAGFWDDLHGREEGELFFKADLQECIIQYSNWSRYTAGSGTLTFQISLYPSGRIRFYYKTVEGTLNSATIGLESQSGNAGVPIAYNQSFVDNELVVSIQAAPNWLQLSQTEGVLQQSQTDTLILAYRLDDLQSGDYKANLIIHTNDSSMNQFDLPVRLYYRPTLMGESWIIPASCRLDWIAIPNPFSEVTQIHYYSGCSAEIQIILFNLLGEQLEQWTIWPPGRGWHYWRFKPAALPQKLSSGIYLLRFAQKGTPPLTKKIMYIE